MKIDNCNDLLLKAENAHTHAELDRVASEAKAAFDAHLITCNMLNIVVTRIAHLRYGICEVGTSGKEAP